MSPLDVLGIFTDELQERFNGLDANITESILKDMNTEDASLKSFIETCQLEKWYQSALDLAQFDFAEEVDRETDNGDKMLEAAQTLRVIEMQIQTNLTIAATKAFRGTKQMGGTGVEKFRSSSRLMT